MVSKTKILVSKSLKIIRAFGLVYYFFIAYDEFKKNRFGVFKHPTMQYYNAVGVKNEESNSVYHRNLIHYEREITKNSSEVLDEKFRLKPKFSFVIIHEKDNSDDILLTIKSIKEQIYSQHEILILHADDKLENLNLDETNEKIAQISEINEIKNNVHGDFICFFKAGNELSKNALFKITDFLNKKIDTEIVYTDNDHLDHNGKKIQPFFKPDWSPYLFQNMDFLSPLCLINKEIFKKLSLGDIKISQLNYEILLRATQISEKISHIKIPLATQNLKSQPYNFSTIKIETIVDDFYLKQKRRIKLKKHNEPLVSIIIPTKNNYKLLKRCITSLKRKTSYKKYEIIIVDNNSTDYEVKNYYKSLSHEVFYYEGNFNFSKISNLGVAHAKGEFFLFLNDDTEILENNWLDELVTLCSQKDVGAVGPKLVFSDNTIQHAGVSFLKTGSGFHPFQKIFSESHYMFNLLNVIRECSAVTGACLITKKEIFNKVNGFDEKYDLYYGDADFCLKIIDEGYKILYTPLTKVLHDGSTSIKDLIDQDKLSKHKAHFTVENHHYFISKWPYLKYGDSFYNSNLGWDYTIKSIE